MTNDEWLETPAAAAMTNFMAVIMGTLASSLGGVIGGFFTKVGTAFFTHLLDEAKKERGDADAPDDKLTEKLRQQLDPEREDPRRNGMTVVAIWSAFESSFDDFTKAVITERPEVLRDREDVAKIRVPVTQLFADGDEKADVILDALKDVAAKGAGTRRCESILKYLDLSDRVPKPISDVVYQSQMVRHIWAHRVGIADAQFVKNAGGLGFKEGDLVSVDMQHLIDYLSAVVMYAMIVMNRHRKLHGLEPVTGVLVNNEKTSGTLREAYHKLYFNEDSEPGKSPTESDDPPASPAPRNAEAPRARKSLPDSTEALRL